MQHLVLITSTVVAFVAIDAVWLSTMYQRFYGARIGHLLAPKADLGAFLCGTVSVAAVWSTRTWG